MNIIIRSTILVLIALATTAAYKPMDPDRLRDKKTCAAQIQELASIARSDHKTYLNYTRILRQRILENPGASHREFSRLALAKILLLKVGATHGNPAGCTQEAGPLLPSERLVVDPWYALADQGAAGVALLRAAIQGRDTLPHSLAQRLLAAHALSLTGIVPSLEMIDEMKREIASEPNADVRFEKILTLTAYAQRNKDALQDVRNLLLTTKDCALAAAVAFSLPGEDLRYKLFHSLTGPKGSRPQNIRHWLRARRYSACRKG